MNKLLLYWIPSLLLWTACSSRSTPEPEAAEHNDEQVSLTQAQIATAGIAWAPMEEKTVSESLWLNGEMRTPNAYMALASAYADGVVQSLRFNLHSQVRQGDILAVLRSAELLTLQERYLTLRERAVFLQADYTRYKTLSADNATALKTFQQAEAALREVQSALQTTAAALRQYQIDPETLNAERLRNTFEVRAPIHGVVAATQTQLGAALQSGDPICQIMDPRHLQAHLYVFEKDLADVKPGLSLRIESSGREMAAMVESISPVLDPQRKTALLIARLLQTPPAGVVHGGFARGQLILGDSGRRQSALPEEALLSDEKGSFVFQHLGSDAEQAHFKRIPVSAKTCAEQGWQIIHPLVPLPPDAQFVVRGAYYVAAQAAGVSAE